MPMFTVAFKDGSTTEVRAFSRRAVLAMYPNAVGLAGERPKVPETATVRAIPVAPQAIHGPPRFSTQDTPLIIAPPRGRFRLNRAAVKAAIAELGLTVPVKIRYHARHGGTNGNYRRKHNHHDIMLKSYLTPEQASSTLWHELTHAMQAERVGALTDWYAFSKAQRSYSYDRRPIEIEARAMSAAKVDSPLTF